MERPQECLTLATKSRNLAAKYVVDKHFGRAFAHMLVCLTICPDWKQSLENTFTVIIIEWAEKLYQEKRYEDLISSLRQALEQFPQNTTILNSYGCFLIRTGQPEEAYNTIKKAVELNPNDLLCEKNLRQIKDQLVPRWHFRMINDKNRNESYRNAIIKKLHAGFETVLDIGTGTGLLAMFASKAGAKSILACDYSKTMIELAKIILKENNISGVKLLHKSSLDIQHEEFDKVSLVITEIFDAGGFGENIINCLVHALEHLVLPHPNRCIIPAGMVMYITAIESRFLRSKSHVINPVSKSFLSKVNVVFTLCNNDPYDTENLRHVKDVVYLSSTQSFFPVNFSDDGHRILDILNEIQTVNLRCIKTGQIDAFAIWMKLNLDDEISISSDPRVHDTTASWDQAIYYLNESQSVSVGEDINVTVEYIGLSIKISHGTNQIDHTSMCFEVPEQVLLFLNDDTYVQKLIETIPLILKTKNIKSLQILDLSYFPILGLLLLQQGADKLVCKNIESQSESHIIDKILQHNNITGTVTYLDNGTTYDNIFQIDDRFDVIVLNLIDETGEIQEDAVNQIPLKAFLKEDGIIFPNYINICGQLVRSDYLDRVSKVNDSSTCGFKIADYINEFKVDKHIDYKICMDDSINASDVVKLSELVFSNEVFVSSIDVVITANTTVNAVLYWYDINFNDDGDILYSTYNVNSFVKNAAFLVEPHIEVRMGDVLNITTHLKDGIMKVHVKKL